MSDATLRRTAITRVAYRGDLWRAAQSDLDAKRAALITEVRDAYALGISEYQLATEVGVQRSTVRAWLGKDGAR